MQGIDRSLPVPLSVARWVDLSFKATAAARLLVPWKLFSRRDDATVPRRGRESDAAPGERHHKAVTKTRPRRCAVADTLTASIVIDDGGLLALRAAAKCVHALASARAVGVVGFV